MTTNVDADFKKVTEWGLAVPPRSLTVEERDKCLNPYKPPRIPDPTIVSFLRRQKPDPALTPSQHVYKWLRNHSDAITTVAAGIIGGLVAAYASGYYH